MTLEERKDNTYYDKTGKQILVGDLLKVYHFGHGRGTNYMYFIVVMEETEDFPVMACRDLWSQKPHVRMYVLVNRNSRIYETAKIIAERDWQTKRKKIKILTHDKEETTS